MAKHVGRARRASNLAPPARVLDTPQLAQVVPHLAPEALHQVIQHCGLEACAELVTSATPAQLASVLHLDLWRNARPSEDERFDADRFGEWLELLADVGGSVAAGIVAAMDESVLVAGLARHVRVFDGAAVTPLASDDDPTDVDATRHSGLERELGGYLVRATGTEAWDAIVALLLALDSDHHERFHAVMRGVRRLSNSTPELDGLDDRLLEAEQLLHEMGLDRDHRRSPQGYSTPADARAFLQMARLPRHASPGGAPHNPIVAEYLRATAHDDAASRDADARTRPRRALEQSPELAAVREALDAIAQPRALLEGDTVQPSRLARIRLLMQLVRDNDTDAYLARGHELAFLANTLVAGCSIQSRCFTPQEASEAAISVCQLGLEHWPGLLGATPPDTFLIDHDLVAAFEVGWALLHDRVCLFAADGLIVALSDLRSDDTDNREALDALRIELTRQGTAGTPWRARNALDVIMTLDVAAWASLLGLLDECPVIPAALTAAIEGRTGAIDATDFAFISTHSQLETVRAFLARLPALLRA